MAKDKDRSVNPAQAQRKAEKAKALKKARNEQQARRNEKLARRNPDRIQRQIDDLKALEASGEIKPREQAILAELERDLKAVKKAKEFLGSRPTSEDTRSRPPNSRQDGESRHGVLGKRQRDGVRKVNHENNVSSGSETDESVRNIPMPRDTPPPAPRNHRHHQNQDRSGPHQLPSKPTAGYEAKTTYSSAPQLRDLKKEATSKFVPDIVRRKQDAVKGHGGLLEPEELDRLEKEGYYTQDKGGEMQSGERPSNARQQSGHHTDDEEAQRLRDEEARFERELAESMDTDIDQAGEGHVAPQSTDKQVVREPSQPVPADVLKDEEEEDEDEDDYLPASMSGGKGIFGNLPTPQTHQQPPSTSYTGDGGASIAAGLFSKLPQPKTNQDLPSRQVQMEDVEDEDL